MVRGRHRILVIYSPAEMAGWYREWGLACRPPPVSLSRTAVSGA